MASRKRQKVDFTPEAVLSEIHREEGFLESVKEFKTKLTYISLSGVAEALGQNDSISLACLMFGFDAVLWTSFAISHVPHVYSKFKKMRIECIFKIVKALGTSLDISMDQLQQLVDFLSKVDHPIFTHKFFEVHETMIEDTLLQLSNSKDDDWNYTRFLSPPVDECIECECPLVAANKPNVCTLYTLKGPRPSTKLTLKCNQCKLYYGLTMYSLDGCHHYYDPSLINPGKYNYIYKKYHHAAW